MRVFVIFQFLQHLQCCMSLYPIQNVYKGNIKVLTEEVKEVLRSYDIECDTEILIKRKQTLEGKNDLRVNGSTVTITMLKNITSKLVDIHGQHEHQAILQDKFEFIFKDGELVNKAVGAYPKESIVKLLEI